jgi:RNA polymerase sigma-70 factor (ECF subfamily)
MKETGQLLPFRRPDPSIPADGRPSDESLVAACAAGDGTAQAALFDRFQGPVYRFVSRLVGARCVDLDDLVQTTFLEAMRAAPRFRRDAAVKTWIFGIAVNVVRHHFRSQLRQRMLSMALLRHPPEARHGPDSIAERRELVSRLELAVAALPHELRAAFVMCELEEIPGKEVARVLNWRLGTLWRRVHEARKALRKALEKEPHESQEMPRARRSVAGILDEPRR